MGIVPIITFKPSRNKISTKKKKKKNLKAKQKAAKVTVFPFSLLNTCNCIYNLFATKNE